MSGLKERSSLMDRWAALTDRERHRLVEDLADAEPARLSDLLTAAEVRPCLECDHTRHVDGNCLAAYLDRDGLDRICWCTASSPVTAADAFNDHVDDALALAADDQRVEYGDDELRDARAERDAR